MNETAAFRDSNFPAMAGYSSKNSIGIVVPKGKYPLINYCQSGGNF